MILPYVYKLTNMETKEFYIGMRSANKVIAEEDLGFHYFSSSKAVKNNFHFFEKEIIAIFFDQESAFMFENALIKENFSNVLCLNKHYQNSMSSFSMKGVKRKDLIEFNKTRTKQKEFRLYTCANCRDDYYLEEFIHHPWKHISFCSKSCKTSFFNRTRPKKIKLKKEKPKIKKVAWNKGIPNLSFRGENNPMKKTENKRKMSQIASGRKRKYRDDGSWYWEKCPTTSVSEQVGTISESSCF